MPGDSRPPVGGNSNGAVHLDAGELPSSNRCRSSHYYGDDFKVECPTGPEVPALLAVARRALAAAPPLVLRDETGLLPCLGAHEKLQKDPHFRDYLPFHEHFHGDDGHGLGSSHQTGWTGLVAKLIQPRRAPR